MSAPSQPPAGWFPDPQGPPEQRRWWDGSAWTEHVQQADVTQPETSAGTHPSIYVAAGGAAAMLVGAFSPWLTGPLAVSRNGTDGGGDGWGFIALALIAGLVIYSAYRHRRQPGVTVLIAGGLGLALGIADYSDAAGRGPYISVGWGLWVCILGSAALALVGLASLRRS